MDSIFERILSVDLVEAGVYLNLHPNSDEVIERAAESLPLDQLLRLGMTVSAVGEPSMQVLALALRKRACKEPDSEQRDELFALLKFILKQNDGVAEGVFTTLAAA